MIFILRIACKRLFLFITIATLVSIFFIFYASAHVSLFSSALDPDELTDGIYNIVNQGTGQYLDVYDTKYEQNGYLYLSKRIKSGGQDFLVKRQDDGTYIIYPQSENGIYSLSYESDIMEGEFVLKKDAVSNLSKFKISQSTENAELYSIKPACMNDDKLSLTVSNEKGKYNYNLAGFALENENSDQQKWQFVKVYSESFEISTGYADVKVGGSYNFYTKIFPSYLTGNLKWESSDPEIATVDKSGKVCGISQGTATITVTCGKKSVCATVNVTPYSAFTWYSQHNMQSGGWYAIALDGIKITTASGETKNFFISGYRTGDDWMDRGCKLCSESMVLHNMGAVMKDGFDIRTGKTNDLEADPFTVSLANSGLHGSDIQSNTAFLNPVLIRNSMISSRFTVEGKAITKAAYTGNSLKNIKELLDQHPEGVVVGIAYGDDSTHYVVFTECINPDDPNGNYEFRICDSAASNPELGDNVLFKDSLSYKSLGCRYSSIFEYSVYNIVD